MHIYGRHIGRQSGDNGDEKTIMSYWVSHLYKVFDICVIYYRNVTLHMKKENTY